jgi:hypothetical protein
MAAATIELSIPPERKHPSGTSETSCRATACVTYRRVAATGSSAAETPLRPLGSKYGLRSQSVRRSLSVVAGGSFTAPV